MFTLLVVIACHVALNVETTGIYEFPIGMNKISLSVCLSIHIYLRPSFTQLLHMVSGNNIFFYIYTYKNFGTIQIMNHEFCSAHCVCLFDYILLYLYLL